MLVVVEGKTLLKRDNLEKMRDLVTDLQLVDGTRGLISLFSARQAPAPGKLPAALFPSDLPQGADYDKFIETVKTNEIIRGKLLSEDGTLALIVLSLEPDVVASSKLDQDDRRNSQDRWPRISRAAALTRNCPAFPSCSSKSATRSSATD